MLRPYFYPGATCPVCGTCVDLPAILVGLPWTKDGDRMAAAQLHLLCADLVAAAFVEAIGPIPQAGIKELERARDGWIKYIREYVIGDKKIF